MGLFAIVVVIAGARGVIAAEPDIDLKPQLANDVQSSIPAVESAPAACPATAQCSEPILPKALCDCEPGDVTRRCDGHEVPPLAFSADVLSMCHQNPNLPDASQFSLGNRPGIASIVSGDCTEDCGLELNVLKHFDRFDDLAGFHSAQIKLPMGRMQSDPGATLTTTWGTHNNLFGDPAGSHFPISDALVSSNSFSFANASFQLSPHIVVRGGYQMLWFNGVAMANKQVAATGNSNLLGQATSHINSADTFFSQFANPGLEVTW